MKLISALIILFGLAGIVQAQNSVVDLKDFRVGDLKYAGFSLHSDKEIHISAEGAGSDEQPKDTRHMMIDPNGMFAYGWIINAKTREQVWRMKTGNTEADHKTPYNRRYEGNIHLSAGEYEVYFVARKPESKILEDGFLSLGRLLKKLLHDEDWYREDQKKWYIHISGVDESVDRASVDKYHNALRDQAVVSITGLRDSDFRQEGFTLEKSGVFDIYVVGEAFDDEVFDYGWIINAENSEKVWETIYERSEYGGGAVKNRVWRERIRLEPGQYWVYFVMDDSHSPNNWNANPPSDPDFYGITVSGVKGKYDPESIENMLKLRIKPIVDLTRLGDNETVQEAFKINQPIQVRIHALGEGRNGEMYDYGWIVNMKTGDEVWRMTYNRTRNGGGADKNRMIDEIISLPAGSYIVYFKTDGSHSYEDWNATAPYNPSSWGITVYPADPKYDEQQIQKLSEDALGEGVISQITRVKDGRHIQKRFTLDKETEVRVYAIGEGDWDEMYDYGWIENEDTGEKVWKMTYEQTRWAGGARKNRKVDQLLTLPPGEYILHYRTDDSHSFNDWNDDPPDDPIHYGITLYKEGEVK